MRGVKRRAEGSSLEERRYDMLFILWPRFSVLLSLRPSLVRRQYVAFAATSLQPSAPPHLSQTLNVVENSVGKGWSGSINCDGVLVDERRNGLGGKAEVRRVKGCLDELNAEVLASLEDGGVGGLTADYVRV